MLGANDGVVSTAVIIVGVASSGAAPTEVRTAGIAGLVAGAMSMAVGEYVSVASQRDAEQADLRIEAAALEEHPRAELAELAEIWEERGLEAGLAAEVARQLTEADALAAHARDELGLTEEGRPRPLQAAATSALAFTLGALLPLAAYLLAPGTGRSAYVVVTAWPRWRPSAPSVRRWAAVTGSAPRPGWRSAARSPWRRRWPSASSPAPPSAERTLSPAGLGACWPGPRTG